MDSFAPRKNIPSFQLKAKVLNQQKALELEYWLRLNGAKEPKNKFLVEVSLPRTIQGVSELNCMLLFAF